MGEPCSIDAIVFDLDGVLIDTETTLYAVWGRLFEDYGAQVSRSEWQQLIGTTEVESPYAWLQRRATRPLPGLETLQAETRTRELAAVQALGPMPGVLDWLDAAEQQGLALGVASSSSLAWVEARLEQLDILGRFSAVICPADDRRSKPAPDVYLAACQALGAAPARALAIEDSANGVRAARTAGLRCLAVPNALTVDMPFDEADHRLGSLAEQTLEQVLALLGGTATSGSGDPGTPTR